MLDSLADCLLSSLPHTHTTFTHEFMSFFASPIDMDVLAAYFLEEQI